jgi:hypothetical protein
MFLLYIAELEDTAAGTRVSIHMYADDIQLYVYCKPSRMIDAVARLEQRIDRVDRWMATSRLKLNSDKSKVIWVGSIRTLQKHPGPEVTFNTNVTQADRVQLFGVGISADFTFDWQVIEIAGQSFYQLRKLRSVRQSLDTDSIKTLKRAFVLSRVDYCCRLLAGSPWSVTDKLQRVLSAAVRVVTNTGKFERGLTRILHRDLHWLDVPERIQLTVAAIIHRCLQSMAPLYLTELLAPIAASARRHGLRSATTNNLVFPYVSLVTYGARAFVIAGPACWNGLPNYLKEPNLNLI